MCHIETDHLQSGASRVIRLVTGTNGPLPFNQEALQRYVLHCAQAAEGGLRDKPGKGRDYYHSCYSLSGLSVAQNFPISLSSSPPPAVPPAPSPAYVYGDPDNLLEPTSVVYNIGLRALQQVLAHFAHASCVHGVLLERA